MKVRIACLTVTLGLAGLASTSPSSAADLTYGSGSIKDMSAMSGTPVPAPIPVPVYKGSWYLRIDAGVGVINTPGFSESGWVFGKADGPGPLTGPADPRTANPSWFGSKFDTFATWGGGAGYNFGNGFRIDLTGEKRTDGNFYINGHDEWQTYRWDNVTRTWGPNIGWKTRMDVVDRTKIGGTVWMANMYYDLWHSSGGFTPYIGGGVGFAWNRLGRNHQETVTKCNTVADPLCQNIVNVSATDYGNGVDRVSLAGAAMAGVSYDINEITTLDVGYRFLYIDGTNFALDLLTGDHSRVNIGAQTIHEMRAGLRFNFN